MQEAIRLFMESASSKAAYKERRLNDPLLQESARVHVHTTSWSSERTEQSRRRNESPA